jgi:hypothetical protein
MSTTSLWSEYAEHLQECISPGEGSDGEMGQVLKGFLLSDDPKSARESYTGTGRSRAYLALQHRRFIENKFHIVLTKYTRPSGAQLNLYNFLSFLIHHWDALTSSEKDGFWNCYEALLKGIHRCSSSITIEYCKSMKKGEIADYKMIFSVQ